MFYVTGNMGDDSGIEFCYSNVSQGIGLGFNTIYAIGANPNQDFNIRAPGTGKVRIRELEISGMLFAATGTMYHSDTDNKWYKI